jgi:trans-aconitate 2-methyltransferase
VTWDADRYLQFKEQRFMPFADLVQLILVRDGLRVLDLGCGTGELTRRLADRLPNSTVLGIDSSPEMLERTREYIRPRLSFERGTIEAAAGEWDVVVSNAAIQWVNDHEALLPHLFHLLAPGGRLAVQLPSNDYHRSHSLLRETAGEEPFRTALEGWTRVWPGLPVDRYAEILFDQGASEIVAFDRVYPHVLESAEAVVEWVSGTALLPYMARLPDSLHEPFKDRYRQKLVLAMPGSPVFFGFKRTLFAGTR